MKLTKSVNLLAVALVLSLTAVGCKTKKSGPTPLGGQGNVAGIGNRDIQNATPWMNGGIDDPNASSLENSTGYEAAAFDPDQMIQDRTAFAAQTVYFGYDSSSISSSEHPKLEMIAGALQADPSARLLIEGHCDERGTEEYNRSLGERRALSARETLAALGVDPARVATRSYGEDRPAELGHDQEAWRLNRRDEFVLLHPR